MQEGRGTRSCHSSADPTPGWPASTMGPSAPVCLPHSRHHGKLASRPVIRPYNISRRCCPAAPVAAVARQVQMPSSSSKADQCSKQFPAGPFAVVPVVFYLPFVFLLLLACVLF